MTNHSTPFRVGFDMDGVLLYNPARIIRPFMSTVKHFFLPKKQLHFYYPKTSIEKWLFKLAHKSSIYNAPGIEEIKTLVDQGKIEAYLITARYNFLGVSVGRWVKKNRLEKTFSGIFFNKYDEEPHLFKEKMIRKLQLDIYVEDNLDIVNHLKKTTQTDVLWIYNILDRSTPFPKKFPHLKNAIKYIVDIIK